MQHGALFQGISEEAYHQMMLCFQSVERTFRADTTICTYEQRTSAMGVLLEGEAALMRTQADGRQTILEYLKAGDIFGEILGLHYGSTDIIQLIALKSCLVQFIDYEHLTKRCVRACSHHSQLVSNALQMMSRRTRQLSERLEVLSQRSTREKLICYFTLMAQENEEKTFELPFSLSTLADYLSVDRSAMMRELKKLKEEGRILLDKRTVTLS